MLSILRLVYLFVPLKQKIMSTKILLFFGALLIMNSTLHAQINKGKYLTGGSFSIYSAKDQQLPQSTKNESLNINIQLGKVIKQNTVAGIILSYTYYRYKYNDTINPGYTNTGYSAGIFYRRYKSLLKDLYFFAEADALYNHTDRENYSAIGGEVLKTAHNGGSIAFSPGISYAVCKRMQLEIVMPSLVSLSYSRAKNTESIFSLSTNLNSNLLSSMGIGFKFLL